MKSAALLDLLPSNFESRRSNLGNQWYILEYLRKLFSSHGPTTPLKIDNFETSHQPPTQIFTLLMAVFHIRRVKLFYSVEEDANYPSVLTYKVLMMAVVEL